MDRFQSMEELIAALQTLTAAPAVTPAGEIPMVSDFSDVPPRHRTGWLAMGFLGALAIGIGGTALVLRKPAKTATTLAPPVPASVQFYVDSVPRGASVEVDGTVMGLTPANFALPAGADGRAAAEIQLSLAGYETVGLGVSGESPVEVMKTLVAVAAPSPSVEPVPVVQALAPKAVEPPKRVGLVAREPKRFGGKRKATAVAKPVSKLNEDDEPVHVAPAPVAVPVEPVKVETELKRPAPN
jgi:hypothetical protein